MKSEKDYTGQLESMLNQTAYAIVKESKRDAVNRVWLAVGGFFSQPGFKMDDIRVIEAIARVAFELGADYGLSRADQAIQSLSKAKYCGVCHECGIGIVQDKGSYFRCCSCNFQSKSWPINPEVEAASGEKGTSP